MVRYYVKWISKNPNPLYADDFFEGLVKFPDRQVLETMGNMDYFGIGDGDNVAFFTKEEFAKEFINNLNKIVESEKNLTMFFDGLTFEVHCASL